MKNTTKTLAMLAMLAAAGNSAWAQGQEQPPQQPAPDVPQGEPIVKTLPDGKTYVFKSTNLALGNGSITYQWYRNDAPIANATDTVYTLPASEAYGMNVEFRRKATLMGEDCYGVDEGWSNIVLASFVPASASAITGSASVCPNVTGLSYSVVNVPGTTYTWVVPNGWTITSGQGSSSILVTAGTGGGTVSVTPSCTTHGYAGIARTLAVTILSTPAQPSEIVANPSAVCSGQTGITYTVTKVQGVSYAWTVPSTNGWVLTYGQGTNSITATAGTGSVTISVTPSICGNVSGAARTLSVTVNAAPAQPSEITTNAATVCDGQADISYTVTNVQGVDYNWTVPNGSTITGGQGTNSITVTAGANAGNVSVTPSTSCGGNGPARTLAVIMSSAPVQPSVITPSSSVVCYGQTGLTYSVASVQYVTYTWAVPAGWSITAGQGTSSITVTAGSAGGNVSVVPSSCGSINGTASSLPVTVGAAPAQPSAITGSATVCDGAAQTYSVTDVQGVTYAWVVPQSWTIQTGQGTNSITVTVGAAAGTVSVTPSNCGGKGAARTLAVSMGTGTAPAQPSIITANPSSYCPNQSGVIFSVTNVNGVSYAWTVPGGWAIQAGQGTNSITVRTGNNSGTVRVTPTACGATGSTRILAVAAPSGTTPAQPSAITANPPTVCAKQEGATYTVTNVPGVTYNWVVPAGWSIMAGQGTNSITATAGTDGGNVTVTPGASGCGSTGTAQTLAVAVGGTPDQPSAITGAATVTTGQTGLTYSVTNVSGVSYNWTVPLGWTVTAGQGTNTVTTTAGVANAVALSVEPTACGNIGTARTLTVTVNATPAQPSAITASPSTICAGQQDITYSVTNVPGTTYTWTVPNGWSITSGQGFNRITVTAGSENGNVEVTPTVNGIAGTTPRSLAVSLTVTPTQPAMPVGVNNPTTVCQGSGGLTYTVTNVSGISYEWSVPFGWDITSGQGTNSITATAGTTSGNVSVTPSTACANTGSPLSIAVATATCGAPCGSNAGIVAGLCWANRNVATVNTFAAKPDMYTQFFQWNRLTAWGATGGVTWTPSTNTSETWTVNPCPSGWRLPTREEYVSLINSSTPAWGTWAEANERGNAVPGRFFGPSHTTCTMSSMAGCVFIGANGYRQPSDGAINAQGENANYWSGTSATTSNGYYIDFCDGNVCPNVLGTNGKQFAFTIRCVQ